jgi:amino acid transporter
MVFGRAALGLLIGFALAFAFHFGVLKGFGASSGFALTFGLILGLIGAAYAAIAFSFTIYEWAARLTPRKVP